MSRNARMFLYMIFALGVVVAMMDCARRMNHKRAATETPQNVPSP
jgi:flagellar biogenesis protein FliO